MSKMNDKQELIDKYIQGVLNETEKNSFDKLLKEDASFRKDVTFHSNLKAVSSNLDEADFKVMIQDIEKHNSRAKRSYTKLLVAASIAILVSLTFYFTTKNTYSTDALFVEYFEPYRNVIQPIERGGNVIYDEKYLAFEAYENEDYDKALPLFSKLYNETKASYYLFYKANVLLKLDRAEEAIPILLEHSKMKDTVSEKTLWYLALAYLKLDDTVNAKKTLERSILNSSYNKEKAKNLLNELN